MQHSETTPLWQPSEDRIEKAWITGLRHWLNRRHGLSLADYADLHEWSVCNPESFWADAAVFLGVRFHQPPAKVLEKGAHATESRWFPGARLNFAEHLLHRQDDSPAIAFEKENGERSSLTRKQLYQAVSQTAQALRQLGVKKGDRVAAFMPNCPQTLVAMLATTSLGAIWSSTSPDFGIQGVLERFRQIKPKVLFAADGYFYNGKQHDSLAKVRAIAEVIESIETCVIVPFVSSQPSLDGLTAAQSWPDFLRPHDAAAAIEFVPVEFDHPLYILYSSGTTGQPKCIVHGTGRILLQHLKELKLHTDLQAGDKLFYYTTCGWMMWNWMASALATDASLVLYDGSPFYPDGNRLFDLIDRYGITHFGTSAKWIQAVEKAGLEPVKSHRLDSLKTVLSTGSPLMPENFEFVYRHIKHDLCLSSISGGTDICSCFALGNPTLPVYAGELQCKGLGLDVKVLDENGQAVTGQPGELACGVPFPAMPVFFWNDPGHRRYKKAYFDRFQAQWPPNGIWCHGDRAEITAHDGLIIYGRSDATLNPGGVRIGTAEIYRQVEKLPEILESIAVGQQWHGDERVVLFVVTADGVTLDDALRDKIRQHIRQNTTPRHVPAKILSVPAVPRTLSGKIVELAVRDTIHGKPVENRDALANPEALDHFANRPELAE